MMSSKLSSNIHRIAAAVAITLLFSACSSTTPTKKPPQSNGPVVVQNPPLVEYIQKSQKEATANQLNNSRETLRAAAVAYPTSKQPWLALAESYFDAGDHGNAILSAQEVIQRDANDQRALGILAVSGLRVSAQALNTLTELGTKASVLPSDGRSQAESVLNRLKRLGIAAPVRCPVCRPTPPSAGGSGDTVAPPPVAGGTTGVKPPVVPKPPVNKPKNPLGDL